MQSSMIYNNSINEPIKDTAPFQLEHDANPGQDPYCPRPPKSSSSQGISKRFKGYPLARMEKPRVPLTLIKSNNNDEFLNSSVYPTTQGPKLSSRVQPPLPPNPPADYPGAYKFRRQEEENAARRRPKPPNVALAPMPAIRPPNHSGFNYHGCHNFPLIDHTGLGDLKYSGRGKEILPPMPPLMGMSPRNTFQDTIKRDEPLTDRDNTLQQGNSENLFQYDPLQDEMDKLQKQVADADDDIQRYKEEKRKRLLEDKLEQVQDYHQLQNYNPWGKPGGGAIKDIGTRKQKFPGESDAFRSDQGITFNTPGGGAPIVSKDGHLMTDVPGDPIIRFREVNRGRELIEPFRYKETPGSSYRHDLQEAMKQRELLRVQRKEQELDLERESLKYNAFARDGLSNNHAIIQPQNPVRTTRSIFASKEPPTNRTIPPPPRANASDYTENSELQPDAYKEFYGGSHWRHPLWANPVQGSFIAHPETSEYFDSHNPFRGPMQNLYFPFGSPGGGAPRRDKEGNIHTHIPGPNFSFKDPNQAIKEARRKELYHRDLEQGIMQHHYNEMEEMKHIKAPVGELTALMNKGLVGKPRRDPYTGILLSQPRYVTDVTDFSKISPRHLEPEDADKVLNSLQTSTQYANDLVIAAQERSRIRELERMREKQEARRHDVAFEKMWGRPGGGAPNSGEYRMANMEESLFLPEHNKNQFLKPVDHTLSNHSNTNFVRNEIGINHENMYELPDSKYVQDFKRKQYEVRAPYATQVVASSRISSSGQ